jgi:glycosyltransferase involved in cell wall biosynthesis
MTPSKVIITSGSAAGGVASFAESLCAGFAALGVPAEVMPPRKIFAHWHDLRNPDVLKILSTTAVFAAPFAPRTLCVAHGFPRADVQGWLKVAGITASFRIANRFSRLIAVSHYVEVHLRTIFNLRVDAVIHNPLHESFFHYEPSGEPRDLITFVGRLHPCKGIDRIFPAICELLHENQTLRACFIGGGELRSALEEKSGGNPRIEFTGPLPREAVRAHLRRTKVFVSACETEALGIAYLEALSQGCAVVMPACGGGLEIAPELIGKTIFLFSNKPNHDVLQAMRRGLEVLPQTTPLGGYSSCSIAAAYLNQASAETQEMVPAEVTR